MNLNIKIGKTNKETRRILRQEIASIKTSLSLDTFNPYNVPVHYASINGLENLPSNIEQWELVRCTNTRYIVRYVMKEDVSIIKNALRYECA